CMRKTRELDGQRRLITEREQKLARLRADRVAMTERQANAADRTLAEHQRQHEHPLQLVLALALERAGPDALDVFRHIEIEVNGDALIAQSPVELRLLTGEGDRESGIGDLAAARIRDDAPLLQRFFPQDDRTA